MFKPVLEVWLQLSGVDCRLSGVDGHSNYNCLVSTGWCRRTLKLRLSVWSVLRRMGTQWQPLQRWVTRPFFLMRSCVVFVEQLVDIRKGNSVYFEGAQIPGFRLLVARVSAVPICLCFIRGHKTRQLPLQEVKH